MAQLTKSEYKDCCGGKGFHRPSCGEMLILPMGEVFESLQRVIDTLGLPEGWLPDERSRIGKRCREWLKGKNVDIRDAVNVDIGKNVDINVDMTKTEPLRSDSANIIVRTLSPKAGKLKKWLEKNPGDHSVREISRRLGRTFSGVEDVKRAMEELQ